MLVINFCANFIDNSRGGLKKLTNKMLSRIRSLFIGASASSASPNSTSNYEFNETSIPVFDDNEYNAEAALVNSSGMEVIHTLNTDNIKSSEPKVSLTNNMT